MIRIFNLAFLIIFLLISKANSLIEIDITRGNLDPLPIAVSPLHVDIKSEKYSQKLVNHLKDDHFFDVEKFPTSVLIIKNVKKISDQNYNITADLTIRGITNEINFISNVRLRGNQFQAVGDIVIDRTKWDVKYRSSIVGTVADKLIEDNIEFKVFLFSVSRLSLIHI